MNSFLVKMFVVALVVAGSGAAVLHLFSRDTNAPIGCPDNEGLFITEIGEREHIALEDLHPPYNSNPPTSGWHVKDPAPWGMSDKPIPDEIQVHNLEHGGILIQYHPSIDAATKRKLEQTVKKFKSKVLLAPRERLDRDIALTAWTYLDKFDAPQFDECRIMGFIQAHVNKGPEVVPD